MADDVFPLTRDNPESDSLGMMYVDDYELYNRLINGEPMMVIPLKTAKDGPPYWLRIIPVRNVTEEIDASNVVSTPGRSSGETE